LFGLLPEETVRCYLATWNRGSWRGRRQLFGALSWFSTWKVWLERRLTAYAAFAKHPELWSSNPEPVLSKQKRRRLLQQATQLPEQASPEKTPASPEKAPAKDLRARPTQRSSPVKKGQDPPTETPAVEAQATAARVLPDVTAADIQEAEKAADHQALQQ
ncbi:unnamed protein product, partial [Polarella glacialis]